MAADQWPPTAESRAEAARYIVRDLGVDPLEPAFFAALCSGNVPVQVSNGMVTVGNPDVVKLTFPAAVLENAEIHKVMKKNEPGAVEETQLVRFVLHCISRRLDIPVAASFIRAQHLARPTSTLCLKLWKECAYLHVSPEPVAEALLCGRPDLIHLVQRFYGEWLRACRSPGAIAEALNCLISTPWKLDSTTTAFTLVLEVVHAAQIAARTIEPYSLEACDIVVDSRSGVAVARRDKALMALLFVCGPSAKHFHDHVAAFRDVKDTCPEAFTERAKGSSALDELPVPSTPFNKV